MREPMMNSKENLTPPSSPNDLSAPRRLRRLSFGMLAFAAVGFIDAGYLTVEHFLNRVPPCTIISGCEKVTTSPYSIILGVPMALMGVVYYLAVILALVLYLDMRRDWIIKWTARVTAFGFVFSLWLVYLQLFVIKAICQYCMLSAATSIGLFAIGVLVLRSLSMNNEQHTMDN